MGFVKRLLLNILANMGALYVVSELLGGTFLITGSYEGYFIAAIIFGILNSFVKPILKLISLPFVLITAGVFILVINGFLVWFAAYALEVLDFEGVRVIIEGGLGTYVSVAILMSIANMVIHWLLKK